MRIRSALPTLALALIWAACSPPATQQAAAPPAVDSAAVKAAVADLWQRWSAADTAADLAALVEMVGDSARIDVMGLPPMVGRAAWKAAAEAGFKTMKYTSMNIRPEMTVPISNELAYENGSYTEGSVQGKQKQMAYGRYAGALRKYPDGKWRIAYIMVFADSTPAVK
jgi:ketosteroid isomerase-like protein